jgi:hypothetical protein
MSKIEWHFQNCQLISANNIYYIYTILIIYALQMAEK